MLVDHVQRTFLMMIDLRTAQNQILTLAVQKSKQPKYLGHQETQKCHCLHQTTRSSGRVDDTTVEQSTRLSNRNSRVFPRRTARIQKLIAMETGLGSVFYPVNCFYAS